MTTESENFSTILVVGDSASESQQIKSLLEKGPNDVLFSETIDEAMNFIDTLLPDLIVVDDRNTDSEHYKICLRIKNLVHERGFFIPIIYVATHDKFKRHEDFLTVCIDFHFPSSTFGDKESPIPVEPDFLQIFLNSYESALLSTVRSLLKMRSLQERFADIESRYERTCRILDRELNELEAIQKSFLPQKFPSHPELELAASYQPSIQVGGDYYDAFQIDENHWGLVIADVSGHGGAAAVVMALTKVAVYEWGCRSLRPGDALNAIDKKISFNLTTDHYVTMFYAVLDTRSMEMTYSSAGHNPMLFYSAQNDRVDFLKNEPRYPLKTFENESYDEKSVIVQPGDRVLLFTDGVTNLQDSNRQMYGTDRLMDRFHDLRRLPPKTLLDKLVEDAERFRGNSERHDDFTILVLGRRD